MKGEWKPEPKGPPPKTTTGRGRYSDLYRWLAEHPRKWAKITDTTGATGTYLRRKGYETEVRYVYEDKNRCDVYVRKLHTTDQGEQR